MQELNIVKTVKPSTVTTKLKSKSELRDDAIKKGLLKNVILPEEIEGYTMDSFIERIYNICEQNSRGSYYMKKLICDSKNLLVTNNPQDDIGDATCGKKTVEIKLVYTSQNGTVHRFTNLRDYQNFDYFFITLVNDKLPSDFKKRFYCIRKDDFFEKIIVNNIYAMHGTKKANENNENVGKCANMKKDDAITLLDEYNLLRGNEYDDLIDFCKYLNPNNKRRKTTRKNKKANKFKFIIDGTIIDNNTNQNTIMDLIRYLGIDTIKKYFWPCLFSNHITKYHNYFHQETFINTRISTRDITGIINKMKKNGVDISLMLY